MFVVFLDCVSNLHTYSIEMKSGKNSRLLEFCSLCNYIYQCEFPKEKVEHFV